MVFLSDIYTIIEYNIIQCIYNYYLECGYMFVGGGGGGDVARNIGNTCNTDAIQYCHNPYEGCYCVPCV